MKAHDKKYYKKVKDVSEFVSPDVMAEAMKIIKRHVPDGYPYCEDVLQDCYLRFFQNKNEKSREISVAQFLKWVRMQFYPPVKVGSGRVHSENAIRSNIIKDMKMADATNEWQRLEMLQQNKKDDVEYD